MPVRRYNPNRDPDPAEWLATDEAERLRLILDWHLRRRVPLEKPRLHAAIQLVVENQIALGIEEVVDALRRLQDDGLSRHDAVHAIACVLSDEIVDRVQPDYKPPRDPNLNYFKRVSLLTVQQWLSLADRGDEER